MNRVQIQHNYDLSCDQLNDARTKMAAAQEAIDGVREDLEVNKAVTTFKDLSTEQQVVALYDILITFGETGMYVDQEGYPEEMGEQMYKLVEVGKTALVEISQNEKSTYDL